MTRIILVDDERAALEVMQEELQEQGWEVAGFSAPHDALVALQQQKYDLGIFDISMPDMTGIELLEKARVWQQDMDVIFITAWPQLSTAIDAVQLGVREYLRRPFELRELVQAINRALAHRSLRRKLEALHKFVSGLKPSQALQDLLAETMQQVVAAIL
jgi:DNA-binding NtrC family response regulator